MERLTSNKPTSDMNMLELAYNSCYADEKCKAKYRDYELDIDSRELVKNLVKDMCDEDLSDMSDEEFDDYMGEMLAVEVDSQIGLLALFYRNLWAMADLREKLKEYEDIEEQGRLIKLPCKVGDIAYVDSETIPTKNMEFEEVKEIPLFFEAKVVSFRQNSNGNYIKLKVKAKWLHKWVDPDCGPDCAYFEVEKFFTYPLSSIGKTVFLTKSAAEAKLKELRCNND